jgi:hypothetical protein
MHGKTVTTAYIGGVSDPNQQTRVRPYPRHRRPRHDRARPGSPAINDDRFPGSRATVPGNYEVTARSADKAAFLAIDDGARTRLIEAAAARTGNEWELF